MKFLGAIFVALMIWRPPITPDIRINFEIMFVAAVSIVSAYFVSKMSLWMGLFLVLATFSMYYPRNTSASEEAHRFIILGVVWFVLIYKCSKTEQDIHFILDCVCLVALANCAMLISQGVFNYDPIYAPMPAVFTSTVIDPAPNVGLMDCPNSVSALLAFSYPAFFRTRKYYYKIRLWAFIPVILVGIVLAKTTGGMLAVACSTMFISFVYIKDMSHKVMIPCVSMWSAMAYIAFVDVPDMAWRLKTWIYALTVLVPQKPIMGGGIGHWKVVFARPDIATDITGASRVLQVMTQGHNEFVQGIMEMGILFGIVLSGYLLTVFFRSIGRMHDHLLVIGLSALVAIIVDSNVFFPFHIPLLACMGLSYMAIIQKRIKSCSKN